MDFRLTEDQSTLVEGVRDFLTGTHGPEVLRMLDADPSRRSPAIRASLLEMGLPGTILLEEQGGLGLGLVEAALIAVECGRAGLAEPFVDTAFVAAPLLTRAGGQEALLARIAAGEAQVALAHPVNPWIADLDGASHLLSADGDRLRLGPVPGATSPDAKSPGGNDVESVDPLRRLSPAVAATGDMLDGAADDLLDLAALMAAAQALGAAEAMLAMAVEYAKIRTQFGQPIGAFQAVKHQLASVAVATGFARPVLLRAAWQMQQGGDGAARAGVLVSHAKVAATDAAVGAAETAIQVHGAMGYTYEVDLHFWMKRCWALAGAWGDRAFHLDRIEAAVIDGAMPVGPSATFT